MSSLVETPKLCQNLYSVYPGSNQPTSASKHPRMRDPHPPHQRENERASLKLNVIIKILRSLTKHSGYSYKTRLRPWGALPNVGWFGFVPFMKIASVNGPCLLQVFHYCPHLISTLSVIRHFMLALQILLNTSVGRSGTRMKSERNPIHLSFSVFIVQTNI